MVINYIKITIMIISERSSMTKEKVYKLILLSLSVSMIFMVTYDRLPSWGQWIFLPIGLVSSLATLVLFIFWLEARNP